MVNNKSAGRPLPERRDRLGIFANVTGGWEELFPWEDQTPPCVTIVQISAVNFSQS
jgi:hypothetical protein